jgi:hypothetical protein
MNFTKNFIQVFSVDDSYLNKKDFIFNYFLYRLLSQQKLNKAGGRTIHGIQLFFKPKEVIGCIQSVGNSFLKLPDGCLSLHEMIYGIKRFVMEKFFMTFPRSHNIFQIAMSKNIIGKQSRSVAEMYGIGMFLKKQFDRTLLSSSFAMTSFLMMRLCGDTRCLMNGKFRNQIANSFLEYVFGRIFSKVLKDPIGFQEAIGQIMELFDLYPTTSRLVSKGSQKSISECIANMSEIAQQRKDVSEKLLEDRNEQYRLEQQRQALSYEFNKAISGCESEFNETRKRSRIFDDSLETHSHNLPEGRSVSDDEIPFLPIPSSKRRKS